ncbi:MAG: rRNA adenine N-6-methyltransferase family protein [Hyphomicrobiales bacterium]
MTSPSRNQMHEAALLFWRQYIRRPFGVGAVMPSGPKLARAMVDALDPKANDVVVELGPGTGAFTRQLIADGVAPENLILIELDRHFAGFLKRQFPRATVVQDSAARLPEILKARGHPKVRCILSGLPLRSMSPNDRKAVTRAVAASLEKGGILTQFSYFHISPLPERLSERCGLLRRRAGVVLSNVPPAVVWRYTKT